MARGGRPKKSDGEQETRQIRVFGDIADMLADLSLVHPKSTAQICDPLLRAEITELHERYREQIDAAKAARLAHEQALEKARQDALRIATEAPAAPRPQPPKKPRRES